MTSERICWPWTPKPHVVQSVAHPAPAPYNPVHVFRVPAYSTSIYPSQWKCDTITVPGLTVTIIVPEAPHMVRFEKWPEPANVIVADHGQTEAAETAGSWTGPGWNTMGGGSYVSPPLPPFGHAIPEPATWAMLLIGFALVGALMRKRKTPWLPAS